MLNTLIGRAVLARRAVSHALTLPALLGFLFLSLLSATSFAGDIRINIPKRTHLTPVQRLNREGVEAVRKHKYDKAKTLFYKAYLYDPTDPFTLNNLGYISELDGEVERAQNFYTLAAAQPTEALVDRASAEHFKGKSFQSVVSGINDVALQINRANVEAVRLISERRIPEADRLLQRALRLDAQNAFTLNNMGVVKEAEGEYDQALRYYSQAATAPSKENVIVTFSSDWRGKPVSEMANANVHRLQQRMRVKPSPEEEARLLNLRGVSALNRNDWQSARDNFLQAYKYDPQSAFVLNNLGFVSETNGDLETAQEFYREARRANGAGSRVGLASRSTAEGMRLFAVADQNEGLTGNAMETAAEARRRKPGPIQLKRRDNTPVNDPVIPVSPPTNQPPPPSPQSTPNPQ